MADIVTTTYECGIYSPSCSLDWYYDNQTWKLKKVVLTNLPDGYKVSIQANEEKKYLDGYPFPNANNWGALRYNTTVTAFAQTITPPKGDPLNWLIVKMYKVGSPVGDVWFELRDVVSGKPGSTIYATSEIKAAADMLGSGGPQVEWWNWPSPYTLVASNLYALVLQGDYPFSAGHHVLWGRDSASPTYTGGTLCQFNGSTWTIQSGIDFVFYLLSDVEGVSWSTDLTSSGTTVCPVNIQHVPDIYAALANVEASTLMTRV